MKDTQPILTVSTAAKLLDIHVRTLMSYEKSNFVTPHRTKTNRRMYSVDDIQDLKFIVYLSHTRKINIKGIKAILEAIKIAKLQNVDLTTTVFPDFRA